MTKKQIKQELQSKLDRMYVERRDAINSMMEQKSNPQVAVMIEKNQGYIMALQDVVELLYSRKIF